VQQFAQILPAPGGGKLEAVRRVLDAVEVVLLDVQVGEDGPVEVLPAGVLLPHAVVLLHVDALHPVQGHHVEVPDGLVVLRRVARRHDEPPLRQRLVAEGLALEELEHHGGQGLADAVDLVQEEDALLQPGPLHQPVNGGEDLAHGVLGDGDLLPAISPLFDEGQADGALSGVVGDGVGHQAHAGLGGDLLHDLGLAHARRAHQQHRPLAHCGDQVVPQLVLGQIRLQGIGDLLLCLFDVHIVSSLQLGKFVQIDQVQPGGFGLLRCLPGGLFQGRGGHHQPDSPGWHLYGQGRLLQQHESRVIGRPLPGIDAHAVGEVYQPPKGGEGPLCLELRHVFKHRPEVRGAAAHQREVL
ncbi:Iron-uptake system permease protein FeuB, partial [Dysosmobacter welbionis]